MVHFIKIRPLKYRREEGLYPHLCCKTNLILISKTEKEKKLITGQSLKEQRCKDIKDNSRPKPTIHQKQNQTKPKTQHHDPTGFIRGI